MMNIKHTVTINLKPEELKEVLRKALGFPLDASVTFRVGSIGLDGPGYNQQGLAGVDITYNVDPKASDSQFG